MKIEPSPTASNGGAAGLATRARPRPDRATPAELVELARDLLEEGIGKRERWLWRTLADRGNVSDRTARRYLAKARAEAAAEDPATTESLRVSMPYLIGEAIRLAREAGDVKGMVRALDCAARYLAVVRPTAPAAPGGLAEDPAATVERMALTLVGAA